MNEKSTQLLLGADKLQGLGRCYPVYHYHKPHNGFPTSNLSTVRRYMQTLSRALLKQTTLVAIVKDATSYASQTSEIYNILLTYGLGFHPSTQALCVRQLA